MFEKDNLFADTSSRISEINIVAAVNYMIIAAAHKGDAEPAVRLQIKVQGVLYFQLTFLYLLRDYRKGPRPYILVGFRNEVFRFITPRSG